jgi:hypothetical protein
LFSVYFLVLVSAAKIRTFSILAKLFCEKWRF